MKAEGRGPRDWVVMIPKISFFFFPPNFWEEDPILTNIFLDCTKRGVFFSLVFPLRGVKRQEQVVYLHVTVDT